MLEYSLSYLQINTYQKDIKSASCSLVVIHLRMLTSTDNDSPKMMVLISFLGLPLTPYPITILTKPHDQEQYGGWSHHSEVWWFATFGGHSIGSFANWIRSMNGKSSSMTIRMKCLPQSLLVHCNIFCILRQGSGIYDCQKMESFGQMCRSLMPFPLSWQMIMVKFMVLAKLFLLH